MDFLGRDKWLDYPTISGSNATHSCNTNGELQLHTRGVVT